MLVKFDKQMIAALLKDASVQAGIEKFNKGIALPEMNTSNHVLEYIGTVILHHLAEER